MAVVNTYIDGVDIADTISAAIIHSIEQVTERVLAAKVVEKRGDTNVESGFDIRAQILANAEILWPITKPDYPIPQIRKRTSQVPPMIIIVSGEANNIRAEILGSHLKKYSFMQGQPAESPEMALRNLLSSTMSFLDFKSKMGEDIIWDSAAVGEPVARF